MTYQDAITQGYRPGATRYQRGYVSRRTRQEDAEVHTAGGSRAGELYVLLPCWHSTNYCYRLYLRK